MGCNNGKASAPTLRDSRTLAQLQENKTLLNAQKGPGGYTLVKEAAIAPHSIFDGAWSNGEIAHIGRISEGKLTWSDGSVSEIKLTDMTTRVAVSYGGNTFTGELRREWGAEDKIHWSDGDVWSRTQATPATSNVDTEALPGATPSLMFADAHRPNEMETTPHAAPPPVEKQGTPQATAHASTTEPFPSPDGLPQTFGPAAMPQGVRSEPAAPPIKVKKCGCGCGSSSQTEHASWKVHTQTLEAASDAASAAQRESLKGTSWHSSGIATDRQVKQSDPHSGSDISGRNPARKERNNCCC